MARPTKKERAASPAHTYASSLVSRGVSLHVVGRLLGHTQPQTTARYAHLDDDALREATDGFGAVIAKGSKEPNVEPPSQKAQEYEIVCLLMATPNRRNIILRQDAVIIARIR